MATTDGRAVFLDTNILVYANVAESPFHDVALSALVTRYAANVELWISRQIIREYLAVLTRPNIFSNPQPASVMADRVRFFETHFQVAEEGPQVTAKLLDLISQVQVGGRQIHDANIVATMQVYGISRLLTHNTKDFERYTEFIDILPIISEA